MRLVSSCFALALLLIACGGGSANGPGHVTSPFTEDDARIFDGAVDFIGEPGDLLGRWREDWARDLAARTYAADVIAIVKVEDLREAVDLDRRASFLFSASVHRVLVGEDEDIEELALSVSEADAGYDSIDGAEDRVLDHDFVAFVKWAQPAEGALVVARWHLSPASQHVVTEVQSAIMHRERMERRQGSSRPTP